MHTFELAQLIQQLGLPAAEIALKVVNGAVCETDSMLVAGQDEVEFYPPVGGGSIY